MARRWLVLLLVLVALAGCFDQKQWLKKFIPPEVDRQARTFLDAVRSGRLQEAREMLHSSLDATEATKGLEDLRKAFTQSGWVGAENIGFTKNWSSSTGKPSQTTIRLDYQIQLEKHWLAGTVVILDEPNSRRIITARFNTFPASLEAINSLTLSGKGLLHYLVALLATVVPVFSLVALVLCIRTRLRRKWLWIIFILLPVGKLSLNWTTGEWALALPFVQVLGSSILRAGIYGAWMVGVSFPLGAVLFLALRKSLTLPAPDSNPPPPLS